MKRTKKQFAILTIIITSILANAVTAADISGMGRAVRPMTNTGFFDLPVTQSYLHPVLIHQNLPSMVSTTLGKVPLDGDFQIYALAFEWALNDQFSIVASKDGYIEFDPDATLTSKSGLADIAAGIKWAFYNNEKNELAMSFKLMVELPTGDDDVWQGNGDGLVIPSFTFLKLYDSVQLAGTLGLMLPIDNGDESTLLYHSWHASYAINEKLFPLLELNHYYVLDEGDGPTQFTSQAGGAVPAIATFEGGDLINLGSANGDVNEHMVTLGLGFRYRINDSVDLGGVYEFPLTDDEESLMDDRITVDMVFRF